LRHVLAFELDVDLGGFASGFVLAGEMSNGAAILSEWKFEDAGVFWRGCISVLKSIGGGNASRRTAAMSKALESWRCLRFGFAAFRFQRAIEIEKAPEPQGGIEETRRGEIQRADIELGAERVSEVSA